LDADATLYGSYTADGGALSVDLSLVDLRSGKAMASVQDRGSTSDLFDLASPVAARLRPPPRAPAPTAPHPPLLPPSPPPTPPRPDAARAGAPLRRGAPEAHRVRRARRPRPPAEGRGARARQCDDPRRALAGMGGSRLRGEGYRGDPEGVRVRRTPPARRAAA